MREFFINIRRSIYFLSQTKSYFKNVILMHLFIIFCVTPILTQTTLFILQRGSIPYLSFDNATDILIHHPVVFLGLISILILLVVAVFFEFAFLLQSLYFIQIRKPVSLKLLLKGTFIQLKKMRGTAFLFFFLYLFLVLPISGIRFNTELLTNFQIPMFIIDFIFENRILVIGLAIIGYLLLLYLAIRLIFVLPEMILNDFHLREAVKRSWLETKKSFMKILLQFVIVMLSVSLAAGLAYSLTILGQIYMENHFKSYSLTSATFLLTVLQFIWLLQTVLTSAGIFFVTLDYMEREKFLPSPPSWYESAADKTIKFKKIKFSVFVLSCLSIFFVTNLGNREFLKYPDQITPKTVSHRGVDNRNEVQNSIESLKLTHQTSHPDYVEMDIQETKDHQFVVYHDFSLKNLVGLKKKPYELNLDDLIKLKVKEYDKTANIVSFDDYLAEADQLNQKLLIEFKTTKNDSPDMIDNFYKRYSENILKNKHIFHSLDYNTVEKLKKLDSRFFVGYVMPFSVVGPPKGDMDFYSIEYTTLSSNFVDNAHNNDKKVYVWTPNDSETMSRMMFYGVDGIITDRMSLLNKIIKKDEQRYSDKMLYFLIGIG
ncbi:glycerophosphoryl diester phosphodiesterase membrane domain-containing protein [Vagococcus vulneris]|uniref:Glycerophosphodiester phosphodiesterase n=1 Tax=Vagococcus vulneris TaxID=1977869 RepID=A0A429ZX27_9ENTE|nr:glycerophosphodiester phosphodiesterase [Vagococcus vulneris]RST98397.1 glycerophosphodiester phosphodiesterase [Vagococcus vulneris]